MKGWQAGFSLLAAIENPYPKDRIIFRGLPHTKDTILLIVMPLFISQGCPLSMKLWKTTA